MKKETLEEAIKYYAHNYFDMHETNNFKALEKGFEAGAKWQQEISYSEDEVLRLLKAFESDFDHENIIRKGKIECWLNLYKK